MSCFSDPRVLRFQRGDAAGWATGVGWCPSLPHDMAEGQGRPWGSWMMTRVCDKFTVYTLSDVSVSLRILISTSGKWDGNNPSQA